MEFAAISEFSPLLDEFIFLVLTAVVSKLESIKIINNQSSGLASCSKILGDPLDFGELRAIAVSIEPWVSLSIDPLVASSSKFLLRDSKLSLVGLKLLGREMFEDISLLFLGDTSVFCTVLRLISSALSSCLAP
jgi:hypothetical protein